MKISIDQDSELVIKAQQATGIVDLKELIEQALQLLLTVENNKK